MLPKGGDRIWGPAADICFNVTDSTDPFCKHLTTVSESDKKRKKRKKKTGYSPFLFMKDFYESLGDAGECAAESQEDETIFEFLRDDSTINKTIVDFATQSQHTVEELSEFLLEWGAGLGPSLSSSKLFSDYGKMKRDRIDKPKIEWLDPSITPLPHAPNLKIYCMYGFGIDTERAYFYRVNHEETNTVAQENRSTNKAKNVNVGLPFVLDVNVDDPEKKIKHGMRFTSGDGSVPLLSLGYICADAWTRKSSGLNPSGTEVYTLEWQHQQEFTADDPFRGGPRSGEHVDILGHVDMTEAFLRVVSDFDPPKESRIVSNIREIAKAINAHPKGGIFKGWRRP
jgi:phospholipid:diacylglycerol acyltransferase